MAATSSQHNGSAEAIHQVDARFCTPCSPFAGAGGPWVQAAYPSVDHLLPFWSETGEKKDHADIMQDIHTKVCPDFRRGYCSRGKGKAGHCFSYHFESQARRPPIDENGKMVYWDVQCPHWNPEMGFLACPNQQTCTFAHGRNEVSYHPAKYKTRMCNGTECRGDTVCCFAHSEEDLRPWAGEKYSYLSLVTLGKCPWAANGADGASAGPAGPGQAGNVPGGFVSSVQQKHRFCASYPNISQCRRGATCAFAHSREEACTPLLSIEEEEFRPEALTEAFFTEKFKTLWCPIGAQHDWQNCPYAHTYQDARRKPDIGYGPQPCPYWSKKDTRVAYAQRCPLGLRCPYSHGAKEQLYHPKYFRTVICRDLQLKGCPRQTLCAFFHRKPERRCVEADDIDYMQPLGKDSTPQEWSTYFLSPPFFQESAGEGGAGGASGSSDMAPQQQMTSQPMYPAGGKGMGGPQSFPGMMPVMKGGGMQPMMGASGNTWYAGYLAGMQNMNGQMGGPGGQPPFMPKRRLSDGGSRTPTTAESDGGENENEEDGMGSMMVAGPWGQPAAYAPGQPIWGGMPFYGAPGGFAPAPYGGKGYPGFMGPSMGQDGGDAWWGPH